MPSESGVSSARLGKLSALNKATDAVVSWSSVTMAMHSEITICRSLSWSLTLSLSRSARPDSLRDVGIILMT